MVASTGNYRYQNTSGKTVLANGKRAWVVVSSDVVTTWATTVGTRGGASSPH